MRLSVIIPCFNEEEALPALLSVLPPMLDERVGQEWEIIFVDDGSRDRTLEIICAANAADARVRGVALSRNFGHQPSVTAGLAYAAGEIVGIMDADLQDRPEVLCELYDRVRHEGYDVCYAVRHRRQGAALIKICYKVFYWIIHHFSEHDWPQDAGDFSVFNRRVHQTILGLPESVRVLRGLRSWVGFRQAEVLVDRPARRHGRSKYSFLRLVQLAVGSLSSFSYVPLRVASVMGLLTAVVSLFIGVLFLLNRIFPRFTILHYYIGANPGTTTIILFLSVISSMLFFCLGMLGEYLVILLKEVKRRPSAIAGALIGDVHKQPGTAFVLEGALPRPAVALNPNL